MSQRVKNIIQSNSELTKQSTLITSNQDDLLHQEKTTPSSVPLVKDNNTEQPTVPQNEPSLPLYSPYNSFKNVSSVPFKSAIVTPLSTTSPSI